MSRPVKFFNDEKMTFTMDKRTLDELRIKGNTADALIRGEGFWKEFMAKHGLTSDPRDRPNVWQQEQQLPAVAEEELEAAGEAGASSSTTTPGGVLNPYMSLLIDSCIKLI